MLNTTSGQLGLPKAGATRSNSNKARSVSESVEVPWKLMGNQRCLTDQQLAEMPWLADFVKRFRHCFTYDEMRRLYVYNEPEP